MASASKLVEYSDDETSSDSNSNSSFNDCPKVGQKRKLMKSKSNLPSKKRRTKLPSLKSVSDLFKDDSEQKRNDNSSKHNGKRRRFAHQKGNWTVHIYIPIPEQLSKGIHALCSAVRKHCKSLKADQVIQVIESIEEFHVSLSIAQPIHQMQIDAFVQSISDAVTCKPFEMKIKLQNGFKCFSNPSNDRHFGTLLIGQGKEEIIHLIEGCNEQLKQSLVSEFPRKF